MPDDNIKPFSNNPHQSFSIIILNKDYEIIGETKFPGNTYAHHLCFVGKKGLYISENNENNPQFDENKLVFRCFTLQGRQAVCPIMTNAFKNCLMKSELRNHKSTMPPTLLPYWVMVAKDAYTKLCQKYITRPILFI